tara:strand:- start:1587 stop:1997 length:411 start_codon:yes stop_codon:yes gene_type:complete
MKIGKSQLRQILIEELGDIISEQVTIEVNLQLRKKTPNLLNPELVEEVPTFNTLMDPHMETVKGSKVPSENFTGNETLNEMISGAKVPDNYYEGSNTSTQTGPLNGSYRPTTITDAADADGENLNELENVNFDAFL